MNKHDQFSNAFHQRSWGGDSRSGPGSDLSYTRELRRTLPALLRALGCRTLLDAPCGDLHWMSEIDLSGIDYIGGDIVADLVHCLSEKHKDRRFLHIDITSDALPCADLWLCRDVLFHISNSDIYKVIFNFINSKILLFATTYHEQCSLTIDCLSDPSSWRMVNLTKAPFNLPPPLYTLWDSVEGFPPRWLAIWSRKQIEDWFLHAMGVAQVGSTFVPRQLTKVRQITEGRNQAPEIDPLRYVKGNAMSSSFKIGPAFEQDGSAPHGVQPTDHGLYEFSFGDSRFSMMSLGDCQVTMAYLRGGVADFEPFSLKIWKVLAKKSNLVLDIGSYTGIYSLLAFSANPNSLSIAFEASQTTFGRLVHNILVNNAGGRICPVHKAISNRSGHLDLSLYGGIYTMSSGESLEETSYVSAWARKRVETITADEIIIDWKNFYPADLTIELPNEPVSLVKIDVEGHEKSTLAGMRRIIERDHPTMLIEVLKIEDLPSLLQSLSGYEAFWVGESGSLTKDHISYGLNALFIHASSDALKEDLSQELGIAIG